MKRFLIAAATLALAGNAAFAASALKIDTSKSCSFTIKLRPDLAPKHVAQYTKLAAAGAYDNVVFHRVIDGFMAQTGDVKFGKAGADVSAAGTGNSAEPNIVAEFTSEHYKRGTVGAARTADPNSANSQFFVMFNEVSPPGKGLDKQYTVWGDVDEAGMKCVDQIAKGEPPTNPDKMTKVTVQ